MNTDQLLNVDEVEVSYKSRYPPSERPRISSSTDAYHILKQIWNDETIDYNEDFWMLLINRSGWVLGAYQVSKGGLNGTIADIRVIFAVAIKGNATSIIISHNHPSGSAAPSQNDQELTKRISKAGDILDIKVLDHVILCRDHYYSFADEGLL